MRLHVRFGVLGITLVLAVAAAFAAPPPTVNVRGQLLNAQGQALPGARDYSVQFFDAASGGSPLGAAITGTADVSLEGLFNISVVLPPQALLSPQAWYEVAVSSGTPAGPLTLADVFPNRVQLLSVPFALESSSANHVAVSAVGAGAVLDSEFGFLSGVTGAIQGQLNAKANAADVYTKTEVDTSLASKANSSDLTAETTARTSVDATLTTNLGNEVTDRQNAVSAEATARSNADAALATDLGNEVTDRQNADTAEATARSNADATLTTNLGNETTARTNADALLVAKAGDTMTGPLNITNNGYVGISSVNPVTAVPADVTDKLYNVGGALQWNGAPAYRFPWTEITSATATMAGNNGYIVNSISLPSPVITLTLPLSSTLNLGDTIRVNGLSGGGWKIAQRASQTIRTATLQIPSYSNGWTTCAFNAPWSAVASSADGTKLVAVVNGGNIYTSDDSGFTWTARTSTNQSWYSVASSGDGTRLIAGVWLGDVHTSANMGATWTPHSYGNSGKPAGLASSADGTKLVVCNYNDFIYTSTNSGTTWTARATMLNWTDVASSADGTKLVACVENGQIYTSSNSGGNWLARETSRNWVDVASSADGTKLIACVGDGQIYTSVDSGVNWTARATSLDWRVVASSADGTKLAAIAYNEHIYISTDSGVSWDTSGGTGNFTGLDMSADGNKLVVCVNNGQIYTYDVAGRMIGPSTTTGTTGFISGGRNTAVELQYVNSNTFVPISHEGSLGAN